jgi:large subunit ribosomal protein L24
MRKIRVNDEVIVIAGKDKGRRGKVVKLVGEDRLIVSGVNMVKKHQKANPQMGVSGAIVDKEASLQISNVAILNTSTQKADRVGFKIEGDRKVRIYKSSGEAINP